MRGGRPAWGNSSSARRGPRAHAFLTHRITVGRGTPRSRAIAGPLAPATYAVRIRARVTVRTGAVRERDKRSRYMLSATLTINGGTVRGWGIGVTSHEEGLQRTLPCPLCHQLGIDLLGPVRFWSDRSGNSAELLATGPNQVWSWDIERHAARWTRE